MSEQKLQIENHYGLKLAALYDEAIGVGSSPLVILLHGNGGWKEELHIDAVAKRLTSLGISALRFDAAGSGDSEGTWEDDFNLSTYVKDIAHVAKWSIGSLPLNVTQIGVWGHSLGGCAGIIAASRYPGLFTALCACQPVIGVMSLDPAELKEWKESGYQIQSNVRFPEIKLPFKFYTDRMQYDARIEIQTVTMPKLLIGGTRDIDAPAELVKEIHNAAVDPKRYVEFDADHSYQSDPLLLGQVSDVAAQFFREFLR